MTHASERFPAPVKLILVALLGTVAAFLLSGCAVALRYPWDKQQEQTTPRQDPKPLPTPPPAATPTPTPILLGSSNFDIPGFGSFQNCHGDKAHNTLLVCDPVPSPTPGGAK